MGGAFGWRSLDKVNVGHRKDPLFGCVWDFPLIPILIHLPYHNHSLTLHTSDTPTTHKQGTWLQIRNGGMNRTPQQVLSHLLKPQCGFFPHVILHHFVPLFLTALLQFFVINLCAYHYALSCF